MKRYPPGHGPVITGTPPRTRATLASYTRRCECARGWFMPRMRISFLVVLCLLFVATRADSGAEQDDALEVARLAMSPRVYDFMIAQMNETLIMTVDRLRTDGKKTPPEAA